MLMVCIGTYKLIYIIDIDALGDWNKADGAEGQKEDCSQYTFQIFDIETM